MNEFEAHEGSYDHLHTKVCSVFFLVLMVICSSSRFLRGKGERRRDGALGYSFLSLKNTVLAS